MQLPYAYLSLKWFLRNYQVDYFGHVWRPQNSEVHDTSFWSGLKSSGVPDNFEPIMKRRFPNGTFAIENAKSFELEPSVRSKLLADAGNDDLLRKRVENASNVRSHLHSQREALRLLSGADVDYDWVMLTRYDCVLIGLPNLKHFNSSKLYLARGYWPFVDMCVIGEPKLIQALDASDLVEPDNISIKYLTPEDLKKKSFLRVGSESDVEYVGIKTALIRSKSHLKFFYSMVRFPLRKLYRSLLEIYIRLGLPRLSSRTPGAKG